MAKRQRFSDRWIHAGLDARAATLDGGRLEIYTGTRPRSVEVSAPADALLATLILGTPAFQPAERGAILAKPIADENSAERAGRARWFRFVTSDGVSMIEGTVGLEDADLVIDNADIKLGNIVRVERFTHSEPKRA